jgi:hypothetical protein
MNDRSPFTWYVLIAPASAGIHAFWIIACCLSLNWSLFHSVIRIHIKFCSNAYGTSVHGIPIYGGSGTVVTHYVKSLQPETGDRCRFDNLGKGNTFEENDVSRLDKRKKIILGVSSRLAERWY